MDLTGTKKHFTIYKPYTSLQNWLKDLSPLGAILPKYHKVMTFPWINLITGERPCGQKFMNGSHKTCSDHTGCVHAFICLLFTEILQMHNTHLWPTCYFLQPILIHIGVKVTAKHVGAPSFADRLGDVPVVCQTHHIPDFKFTQFVIQVVLCGGWKGHNVC